MYFALQVMSILHLLCLGPMIPISPDSGINHEASLFCFCFLFALLFSSKGDAGTSALPLF